MKVEKICADCNEPFVQYKNKFLYSRCEPCRGKRAMRHYCACGRETKNKICSTCRVLNLSRSQIAEIRQGVADELIGLVDILLLWARGEISQADLTAHLALWKIAKDKPKRRARRNRKAS
jgi:hypothetical protein